MEENTVVNDSKQYIVVKLDNEQYGIDISFIDNIVRMQQITRVPKAQPYFAGVINLRGEIIPVMCLRTIGVLVDEVREVVSLDEENIEKTVYDEQGNNLIGVGKYNDTLISLLNIQGVIQDIDNA